MKQDMFMYLPAKRAGIVTPDDLEKYDEKEYPHWSFIAKCAKKCSRHLLELNFEKRVKKAKRVAKLPAKKLLDGKVTCGVLNSSCV